MTNTNVEMVVPKDSARVAALRDEICVDRLTVERDLVLAREKLEALQKLDALQAPSLPISWWLPAGMGAFGLMLGGVAGLSSAQGISQALLAGVSSFVGGVLLTYAGFKRTGSSMDRPDVDAGKVGAALFLFSIGVLTAGFGFTALRFDVNVGYEY